MRTIKLTEETRQDLLEKLLKRSPNCYGEYEGRVTEIVNTVRAEGDKALFAIPSALTGPRSQRKTSV